MKFWLIHLAMRIEVAPRQLLVTFQILLLTWSFIWCCYCYMLVHMILGVYFMYPFASLLLSKGSMLEYMRSLMWNHNWPRVASQIPTSLQCASWWSKRYCWTTTILLVKTCSPNTYKPSTCFAVVKTEVWARQLWILPHPFRVILNPGKFGRYGGTHMNLIMVDEVT